MFMPPAFSTLSESDVVNEWRCVWSPISYWGYGMTQVREGLQLTD